MDLCEITCNINLKINLLFTGWNKMSWITSAIKDSAWNLYFYLFLNKKYPFTEICDHKWARWEISRSMYSGRWQISDDSSVGGHDWFQTLGCIAFNENQWLAVSVLIAEDVLTATSCLDHFLFLWVWCLSKFYPLRFLFWWPRVSITKARDIRPTIRSTC